MVNDQYPQYAPLFPAHRLDRDTTGVILYAKGKENQERFMALFKEKKMSKTYIAFIHGRIEKPKGRIRIPIKDWHQRRFAKHLPAQSALTEYELLSHHQDYSVLQVHPITGRTNQIRIHFTQIGHPLVGEDKYVFRRDYNLRFRRCALHAMRLVWKSLETNKEVCVEAQLPRDMQEFLEKHP
jgi:RluA family pseudouridine synthase